MKTQNLISVYQGAAALEKLGENADKKFKVLKPHEIGCLNGLCDILQAHGCDISDFDGFLVGYTIGQIGKEFDLLSFSPEYIINIELKSKLKTTEREEKILKQLRKNNYYLKFLGRPLQLFTYVDSDGFYKYVPETDSIVKVEPSVIASCIHNHRVDYSIDPDREFVPSNYLVSPFNSTSKFISGEYFLTGAQQKIKEEITGELQSCPFMYFSISADAGTGKTLMMYDIAKDMMKAGIKVILIHCGKLNQGHEKLRLIYDWNIKPISSITTRSIDSIFDRCEILFVDEAQRVRKNQLELIIQKTTEKRVPVVFSYDVKQYLRSDEGHDIETYLKDNHPCVRVSPKHLTNKIRTNKKMASFINNLRNMGSSTDHLDYDCVTIEYFDEMDELKKYFKFLQQNGWTTLTFTSSQYSPDPYDSLSGMGMRNAHDVIGQEFSKVAFVMDNNFKYVGNRLAAKRGYYSAQGMLYQIVTRVIDELKIVVLDNPSLYLKLLEIKALGH